MGDGVTVDVIQRGQPVGLSRRKAWIGEAYFSALCAEAGFAWNPTPGERDIHSLDGSIAFWSGHSTPVQIKGTAAFVRSKSYRIQKAWRENWEQLSQPSYLVAVTVPKDVSPWTYHEKPRRTLMECAAYWARIDRIDASTRSVQLLIENRLTVETLLQWRDEAVAHTERFFGA